MPSITSVNDAARSLPPHLWLVVSAIFHYLGPAFAVMLFPVVGLLGVAWLRIATAAVVFATWVNPIATLRNADATTRMLLICLGACFALMNSVFYLALDRLPMSLVAAMEFVGVIAIALHGQRTIRNLLALALAVSGVLVLMDVQWATDSWGLVWSALNATLFAIYIILGHRLAKTGAADGVQYLGAAMFVAFILILPFGLTQALVALASWNLLLAGVAVGICSSVIPYICDQMAMSRLPRSSFALLLSMLPASAAIVGALVLRQIPSPIDLLGILLVITGVAIHDSLVDNSRRPIMRRRPGRP